MIECVTSQLFGVFFGQFTASMDPWLFLATASSESFGEVFFVSRNADRSIEWIGTGITWILLLMSVVGLGGILYFAFSNRSSKIAPEDFMRSMEERMKRGEYREALRMAEDHGSFFGDVISAGLLNSRFGFGAMLRALEQRGDELITTRVRKIEYLNVLGQVSPMIGLFGTVYGMILAFQAIVKGGGGADPVLLAGGIGTALTTTFWGLVVAIPSLAGYALIRSQIDERTTYAMNVAEEIISVFRPRRSRPSDEKDAAES